MPHTARVEPTARSIPPVIITATWPSAMIPMKAKFRVTLKKFSSFQKDVRNDGSRTVITIGMRKTAIVTQKAWLARTVCSKFGRGLSDASSTLGALLTMVIVLRPSWSCGSNGSGDQARDLFGRGLADRLVGDLVAAPQDADPIGHGEHVGHAVADQHDGDSLVAKASDEVEHLRDLAHRDRRRRLVHEHDPRLRQPRAGDRHRLPLAAGHALHQVARPGLRFELGEQFRGAFVHGAIVEDLERPEIAAELAAEEDVGG